MIKNHYFLLYIMIVPYTILIIILLILSGICWYIFNQKNTEAFRRRRHGRHRRHRRHRRPHLRYYGYPIHRVYSTDRNKLDRLFRLMDKTKITLWSIKTHIDVSNYVDFTSQFYALAWKEGISQVFIRKYNDIILVMVKEKYSDIKELFQ